MYVLLLVLLAVVAAVIVPLGLACLVCAFSELRRGRKLPRRRYPSVWHDSFIIKKIFWLFPKMFIHDLFTLNPDAFPMDKTGLVIFEGAQGSGKSVGAVWYLDYLRKNYPKMQITSNIGLSFADSRFDDWTDIVFKGNGEFGQAVFIDEIQNYFNSLESKNFPPEMLQEICQQRKQRKTIVGTVQVFGRVAKPIREQTSLLVRPVTIAGCLTILSFFVPKCDSDGQVTSLRRVKTRVFVHSPELREAYDTFETVEHHALHGFRPRSDQILAAEKPVELPQNVSLANKLKKNLHNKIRSTS